MLLVVAAIIFSFLASFIACFIRPPGTVVREVFYFVRDVFFLSFYFFISPRVLRRPSADRPETWPHGRKLSEFCNPSPKIGGPPPKKSGGQKHAKFRSILYNVRL